MLLIFLITPLPSVLISVFTYGISINNVMAMLDILVMYAILNIEQGREKSAVEKELSTARSIQEGVLPSTFPLFPERDEFDVHASMDPAKEVGGDFYDIFFVDHDHLALVMGDVAGKGIPAALFMLMSRTLIKNRAMMGGTPAEVLQDVNKQLYADNKARMFVTIWMAIIDMNTGHMFEANAGH
ncbi:MAG: SpoIIE family protein phosphatase [Lachnospiraceae bacterium]|nr:SpoIIE family protein phosphatase [Lachnospiraceae bacterium]